MPTYAHTTKAAGTVLAGGASGNYNTDHQNHITNQTPQQTQDYSDDAATMRTRSDPFPSGSESLATDLSGELARLRYQTAVLLDYLNGHAPDGAITGALTPSTALGSRYWYEKTKNPMLRAVGARIYKAAADSYVTSAAVQAMTFDTHRYDLVGSGTGFHILASGATTRLTVPAGLDGIYHLGGSVSIAADADGTQRQLSLRLNGTTYIAMCDPWFSGATSSQAVELQVSCDYKLAATDYVELMLLCDQGAGALAISGPNATGGPEFWCHLVGYGA